MQGGAPPRPPQPPLRYELRLLATVLKPPLAPTQKMRMREAIGLMYVRIPHARYREDRELLEAVAAYYELDQW